MMQRAQTGEFQFQPQVAHACMTCCSTYVPTYTPCAGLHIEYFSALFLIMRASGNTIPLRNGPQDLIRAVGGSSSRCSFYEALLSTK